jgi:DNA-binding beta-propeller fold protein YncE
VRRPLAAAALAAVAVGMPVAALAGPRTDAGGGDFRLADERIGESSGLALSHRHPHVVWTANDSGDSARVFAVDTRTGQTVGVHRFGADVRDVEALAMTPDGKVLVGDIGDNGANRSSVRVYSFAEPTLGETSGPAEWWQLTYPDGPQDAESLAVNPTTGRVYVVTKGQAGAVYALPVHPSRSGTNRLTRVAAAPSVATDAVFLTDGSALAVRTYLALVLLDGKDFHRIRSGPLPMQPQGETIALAPDGQGLLAGSEGQHSLVQEVAVPTRTVAAPPAATTTSSRLPAPTATPATSPPRLGDRAARPAAVLGGTGILVAGAVLVTVLLCLVTWGLGRITRRRPGGDHDSLP